MIPFDAAYRGMRFYKCDLQMQTPAEPLHWRGQGMGASAADRLAAAEAYLRRCYEVGLEVIAITDHNFASKDFLPCLREAIDRLANEFGYEIVLFPGLEFTADVGKGVHVLAIFDPDTPLETIDHILTQCGVLMPRVDAAGRPRKSTCRLPEILEVVQQKGPDGLMHGIVILPHSQSAAGIFDTERVADWLQAEEYLNEDLLCLEVPKPVSEMSEGWGRLLRAGPDCDPAWRRKRSIACIMSSDAKALRPEDGASNYIGFRHTWIKMSCPSIEALRQAFLDHDSRIRFGAERPEEAFNYPKIRSVSVRGAAFLADQHIVLSPNLTALIGGRGTGKSTLIEYLRIVTGQEGSIRGDDAARNFQRLKQTIKGDTRIQVVLEKEEQLFRAESRAGAPSVVTEGVHVPDLARFFPVRVLSQREIYAIAEDREARRRLIDDVARRELDEIGRREKDLVREIETLNRQIASLRELKERERALETERRDFEVRLTRLRALEAPLGRWKGRMAEERFFGGLETEATAAGRSLRDALAELSFTATALGSELAEAPSHGLTSDVARRADTLLDQLKRTVEAAVTEFERGMRAMLAEDAIREWRATVEAERTEFERHRRELVEQGTDPDLYLSYQRDLRERDVQLAELRRRIQATEDLRKRRDGHDEDSARTPGLIDELRAVWRQTTDVRTRTAEMLTSAVPRTATGQPFVEVSVEGSGDEQAFLERLRQEIRDKRRMSDDDWDEFMHAVFRASRALAETSTAPPESTPAPKPEQALHPLPPTAVLAAWVSELRSGRKPDSSPWAPGDRRAGVLVEWLTEQRLWDLRTWPVPDQVRIQLYRQDGTLVGDLEGRLSVGQRCTAVLALILARDDVPVVIDQPEEDLDNEFIFAELVPLLRRIKEQRQVIVATHNANIPVNGDAEVVIALEARGEWGRLKEVDGDVAVGGLDRQAVKLAVENIMEGSEEAFRRRYEKYGF